MIFKEEEEAYVLFVENGHLQKESNSSLGLIGQKRKGRVIGNEGG